MTEGYWRECTDPSIIWGFLDPVNARLWKTGTPDPTPSARKARLLACAIARLLDRNMNPRLVEVVEACEQIADGGVSPWGAGDKGLRGARVSIDAVWGWIWACTAEDIYHGIRESFIQERGNAGKFYRQEEVADLIREIIGNPFRSSCREIRGAAGTRMVLWPGGRVDSLQSAEATKEKPLILYRSWLTPTTVSLAEAAYADRTARGALYNDRLAVLADAMEDAGCDDEEMLRHLRSQEFVDSRTLATQPDRTPHVRGCWVLDRILGKS